MAPVRPDISTAAAFDGAAESFIRSSVSCRLGPAMLATPTALRPSTPRTAVAIAEIEDLGQAGGRAGPHVMSHLGVLPRDQTQRCVVGQLRQPRQQILFALVDVR